MIAARCFAVARCDGVARLCCDVVVCVQSVMLWRAVCGDMMLRVVVPALCSCFTVLYFIQ